MAEAKKIGGTRDFGIDFAIDVEERAPDQFYMTVQPEDMVRACDHALNELGARFLISRGTDERDTRGDFSAANLFSLDEEHVFLTIEARLEPADPQIDSISEICPGASWSERETQDLLGISVNNLNDDRRLVLPDDWPEDLHPLRRDVPHDVDPEPVEGMAPERKDPPEEAEEATVMAMGPFFPTLEEPAYFRLFVDGEDIVGCDYRGFYNHRGIEKLGDSALTYNQVPYIAERICGICGFIHSTAYCEALERAIGVQAPDRALYIRSIMLELERIHSHILWFGIAAHIIGFETAFMQSWRMREPVMWLSERISGNRKTYGMNCPGGVRRDIPQQMHSDIRDVLDTLEADWSELYDAIKDDTTLMMRLENVGPIPPEDARAYAIAGPSVRGSGLPRDARVDQPYSAYDRLPVNVITDDGCDTLGRTIVRIEEVLDSINQIRVALDDMPDGEIVTPIHDIPVGREGICTVEAPRGEAIHYVLTGPENRLDRWRVRAPTYQNLQAVPVMLKDQDIADVPISIGSLDPCFSCTERMELVDRKSGTIRLYSAQELAQGPEEST